MCGIIGILGKAPAASLLIDGLRRLEYRGYDSAGVATLVNGSIQRRRVRVEQATADHGDYDVVKEDCACVSRCEVIVHKNVLDVHISSA